MKPFQFPHHAATAELVIERVRQMPGAVAVLIAGSVARGVARPDSDLDVMAVVEDDAYAAASLTGGLTFYIPTEQLTAPCPYIDGKVVSRSFLAAAAERGSEPTRHAFIDAGSIWATDSGITSIVDRIPVYPEAGLEQRIAAFHAQVQLQEWFFWWEAKRRQDPYLQMRSATDCVLFGGRIILAHNRILFPCQKRLMEYVEAAPERPVDLPRLARELLETRSDEAMKAYCACLANFRTWPSSPNPVQQFIQDVETSWFGRGHAIAEW